MTDPGGPPARAPDRTEFFHFCIHFNQKAAVSEVTAPQWVSATPSMENPGSATADLPQDTESH